MAVITAVAVRTGGSGTAMFGDNVVINKWGPFASGDTFNAFQNPGYSDRSVQVEDAGGSSFGSGVITIEGSNDGTNYHTLNDASGAPLSFTAGTIKQITELTRWIRPKITGSGATAITVTLVARQNN